MKSVLFIVDIRDWAFDHIADHMKKALKDDYQFTTLYVEDYNQRNHDLIYEVISSGCDVCFVFWRFLVAQFMNPVHINNLVSKFGMLAGEYIEKLSKIIFLTAIYDHLFEEDFANESHDTIFNILVSDYYVCSMLLKSSYDSQEYFKHPLMVIQDAVDLDKFRPNCNSKDVINDKVIIGWAGNSSWGGKRDLQDHKGVETILKPVVDELIQQEYPVELHCADSHIKKIPYNQMSAYYESIDIYICVSNTEGTPNTVLEAMAVGLPVISTRVGIVPELFGERQKDFILENRTRENLREKLISLVNHADLRNHLAEENKQRIKAWDLDVQAAKFRTFFNQAINNAFNTSKREKCLKKERIQSLLIKKYSELYFDLEKKSAQHREVINKLKTRIGNLQEQNIKNLVRFNSLKDKNFVQIEVSRVENFKKPFKSVYSFIGYITKKTYNLFYDMKLFGFNRFIKKMGFYLWNIDQ